VSEVSWGNWFGGIYIDEKNFFANFAVDAKSYFDLYPNTRSPTTRRRPSSGTARVSSRGGSSPSGSGGR
jgi:hypothetical protein